MAKINKALAKAKEYAKNKAQSKVTKGKIMGFIFMVLMSISPAAATTPINWSEITAVIDGFVGIIPSFASMVSAVMPMLLMISMYLFIMKFWDKILDGIDAAFHFGK